MKRQDQTLPLGFCLKIILITAVFGYGIKLYIRWIATSETFRIREITVEGQDLLQADDILQLGGLEESVSIWDIDLQSCEKKIGDNAFVATVNVHRRLPSEFRVEVVEKQPVALLNFRGKLFCVDWEGVVLPSSPGKLYDLPVLSGEFEGGVQVGSRVGAGQVQEGLDFLKTVLDDRPELYSEISEIIVGRPEGIVVTTKASGIPVWMGSEEIIRKIRYFKAILETLRAFEKPAGVEYIDLRFMGQIILGMRA